MKHKKKTNNCRNIKLHETGLSAQPVSMAHGRRKPCCMNKSKEQKEYASSSLMVNKSKKKIETTYRIALHICKLSREKSMLKSFKH